MKSLAQCQPPWNGAAAGSSGGLEAMTSPAQSSALSRGS